MHRLSAVAGCCHHPIHPSHKGQQSLMLKALPPELDFLGSQLGSASFINLLISLSLSSPMQNGYNKCSYLIEFCRLNE